MSFRTNSNIMITGRVGNLSSILFTQPANV